MNNFDKIFKAISHRYPDEYIPRSIFMAAYKSGMLRAEEIASDNRNDGYLAELEIRLEVESIK